MTVETENFDTSERESKDTRERRRAVVKKLRDAALLLNKGGSFDVSARPVRQAIYDARKAGGFDAENEEFYARHNWNNNAARVARSADMIGQCTRLAVAYWLFDDPSKNRLERGRCTHRLCPHCHQVTATRVGIALSEIVKTELEAGSELALLTLPIKHQRNEALKTVRKAVSEARAKLSQRSLWKCLVLDYHRVAEVERSRVNGWNAHHHELVKVSFSKVRAQANWRAGKYEPASVAAYRRLVKEARRQKRAELAALKEREREMVRQDTSDRSANKKSRVAHAALAGERRKVYEAYDAKLKAECDVGLFWWFTVFEKKRIAAARRDLASMKRASMAAVRGLSRELSEASTPRREIRARCKLLRDSIHTEALRLEKCLQAEREWNSMQARFVVSSPADIENWLREEWRTVTTAMGRESYVLRYSAQKRVPGEPDKILRSGTNPKTGQPYEPKAITKFVQELVKYVTKGHGRGKKLRRGQVGFFDYSPWEVADYLRGLRHWHLHQSSLGWKAAQQAYDQSMNEVEQQAEKEEGGRRVSIAELVRDVEDAVAGTAEPDAVEETIKTGLAILAIHKREHDDDPHFSMAQHDTLATWLARLLGDDRSKPREWKLTLRQKAELAKLRGHAIGPGVDVDKLQLIIRDRRRALHEAQAFVVNLPFESQYTKIGADAAADLQRAEQSLRYALDELRKAEERKQAEVLVDRWVDEERAKQFSWHLEADLEENPYALRT